MRTNTFFLTLLGCAMSVLGMQAAQKGIPAELLKGGNASYDKSSNTLIVEDGYQYRLSKGLVVLETGKELRILLKGNASFNASVVSKDDIVIEAPSPATLSFTSNISGSALTCPNLTVKENVTLNLLSRNSSNDMHALDCSGTLPVDSAVFCAETTTASLAVQVKETVLRRVRYEKPKGGIVSAEKGGICFGDGIPAKIVRIKPVQPKEKSTNF